MNWYLKVLKDYAVFNGRAGRKEYWYFILIHIVTYILLAVIDGAMGSFNSEVGVGLLSGIYMLAVLIPALAVTVRRFHDTERSGWWVLVVLIPFIGGIVLLVFMALDSTPGDNQYGSNPKMATA